VMELPEKTMLKWFELCFACSAGNADKVTDLIAQGVDVNHADYDKRTALHIAASDGREEIVRLLLHAGANPACKDRWNHSPIDDAEIHGHTEICRALKLAVAGKGLSRKGPAGVGGSKVRRK
jgi:glutaminase